MVNVFCICVISGVFLVRLVMIVVICGVFVRLRNVVLFLKLIRRRLRILGELCVIIFSVMVCSSFDLFDLVVLMYSLCGFMFCFVVFLMFSCMVVLLGVILIGIWS